MLMGTGGFWSSRLCAEKWLRQLCEVERCKWCGEGEKRLDREQLCAACKRTQRYVARVRAATKALPSTATKHECWKQTRELRIAEKMVDLCKADGEYMENILGAGIFDAVSLERSLSHMAFRQYRERHYYGGLASQLSSAFSPEQRRVIAYLLWLPVLVDRKRRRMMMASRSLLREDSRRAEREFATGKRT